MHRGQVLFSLILVVLLTVLVSAVAFGKGHVPAGKVQMCAKGKVVKEVGTKKASKVQRRLDRGDFFLPACDFGNVFHKGDDCSSVSATGDFADGGLNAVVSACGVSPACTAVGSFTNGTMGIPAGIPGTLVGGCF